MSESSELIRTVYLPSLTQLVHCVLIYDLIKIFVSNFTELDVELLLIIVQSM